MRSYEATATIDAGQEAVWAVLTDAPGYAEWDSSFEQFARGLKARAEQSR